MGDCKTCGMTFVVLICLTQTIGFFSPVWFCKYEDSNIPTTTTTTASTTTTTTTKTTTTMFPGINRTFISDSHTKSINNTCDFDGLYYPGGIKDKEVFGLCITSMIGVWLCTGIQLYFALCRAGEEGTSTVENACSVMFLIFQILAGVAGFICISRYDRIGWSLIMFMLVGVANLSIIAMVIALLCICYCICSDDDDNSNRMEYVNSIVFVTTRIEIHS